MIALCYILLASAVNVRCESPSKQAPFTIL